MKDERLYLHHMLERCERVAGDIVGGRDLFFTSEQQQDAVIRNLELIGEAAKRVGPELRATLPAAGLAPHLRHARCIDPRLPRSRH